jgi:hypothetical protein
VIDQDLNELDEWSKKWLRTQIKQKLCWFSNTDIPW